MSEEKQANEESTKEREKTKKREKDRREKKHWMLLTGRTTEGTKMRCCAALIFVFTGPTTSQS